MLVLTIHDDDASLHAALQAGARGYLLKEASGEDIVRALIGVVNGDAVFGRSVARLEGREIAVRSWHGRGTPSHAPASSMARR